MLTVILFLLTAPEGKCQLFRELPFEEDSRLDRLWDVNVNLRPLQLIAIVGKSRLSLNAHFVTMRGDEVVSDLVDSSILIDHSRHRHCQDGLDLLQGAAERSNDRTDKHALQDELQICLVKSVHDAEVTKTQRQTVLGQAWSLRKTLWNTLKLVERV